MPRVLRGRVPRARSSRPSWVPSRLLWEKARLSMELIPTRRAQGLEAPLPLAELTELVRARALASADYPGIPLRETQVEEDGRWRFNGHAGRLTDHAFRQLCARL